MRRSAHRCQKLRSGEWARAFPLEHIFKAFGSYFVRRRYREPLYHAVLERYVQLITREGVTQGIFLEGGTSNDTSGVINEHKQVYKTEVVFNTVINSGGILVGGSHPLDPVDCTVAYNLAQGPGRLYGLTPSSKNITFVGSLLNDSEK